LPDLSNIHNAERVIECSPSISQFEAPWRVSLASGETLRGRVNTWPLSTTGSVPANRAIRRYETTGEGELIVDNAATIATAIRENNARIPGPPPSSASGGASGGGCSATHSNTHASSAWMVSLLGALALVIRRRR
jgi:MYXO-CTERM domain-containing protein